MTGFNLPPGCNVSDIPGNGDESCQVCFRPIEICICPECSVCQTYGDPICYVQHGLVFSDQQNIARAEQRLANLIETLGDYKLPSEEEPKTSTQKIIRASLIAKLEHDIEVAKYELSLLRGAK